MAERSPFDGLSERQIEALYDVAFGGQGAGFSDRTMQSLADRGMVVREQRALRGVGNVHVFVWVMPVGVHAEFCEWCATQDKDGEDA